MQNKELPKIISLIKKLLSWIVVSFACFLILFLLINTILAQLNANNKNYKPLISLYTIVSPSMTPVIDVYDVVVNVKAFSAESIEIGDIITFKSKSSLSEGMTITHRVIEVIKKENGKIEFVTQGDHNENPDAGYVQFEDIIGKEIFIIPGLGNLQFLLATKRGWIFLILIPIAILIIKDIFKLIDLFGLNNKVHKVISETDDSAKKQKENERKELIKERLITSKTNINSYKKSDYESPGFLEKYSESIINADNGTNTIKKETIIRPSKLINKEDQTKQDNLNNKIEEYNKKIAELDNMINELENNAKVPVKREIKEENYLKEKKIKVINTELTKNQKNKKEKEEKEEKEASKQLNLKPNYVKETKKPEPPKKKRLITIEKIK